MVDPRNVIFFTFAIFFFGVGTALLIVNFDKQFDAAGGVMSLGAICLVGGLVNCLGLINKDEEELFDDEKFEAREEALAAQA